MGEIRQKDCVLFKVDGEDRVGIVCSCFTNRVLIQGIDGFIYDRQIKKLTRLPQNLYPILSDSISNKGEDDVKDK